MDQELVRKSRFVSLVLRHRPEAAELRLDPQGWVPVEDLLVGAARAGRPIDRLELERIVAENDKQRFELSADGQRIRARQGHSVDIDLELPAAAPPDEM